MKGREIDETYRFGFREFREFNDFDGFFASNP
jgi:hypothetical protein